MTKVLSKLLNMKKGKNGSIKPHLRYALKIFIGSINTELVEQIIRTLYTLLLPALL